MKKPAKILRNSFTTLAILSAGLMVYIMAAIILFREDVFIERAALSGFEITILIGFAFVVLFDGVSFLWLLSGFRYMKDGFAGSKAILLLWALCVLSLFGAKVMADEIGREYAIGWEVLGEWIILYIFLSVQLFYNILILFKLFHTYKVIW